MNLFKKKQIIVDLTKPLEDGWLSFSNDELAIIKHKLGDPELFPILKKLLDQVRTYYALKAVEEAGANPDEVTKATWQEQARNKNYREFLSLPEKADQLLKQRTKNIERLNKQLKK